MKAPSSFLAGLGGFAADLYLIATCRLNNPHSYLKFVSINQARKATRSTTFIETGTYLGATAYRCSRVFEKVYTIELNRELVREARGHLSRCSNVEVIEGDAAVELENLFQARQIEQATVFLDGHYSGGRTSCGTVAEPAIAELEVLAHHLDRINAVIIDDFRNFGVEPGHPTKSELLWTLEEHFPVAAFTLQVQNDLVIVKRR